MLFELRIAGAIIAAAAKVDPYSERPLDIPNSNSIKWLREELASPQYESALDSWLDATKNCESPIEVLMLLGLCATFTRSKFPLIVVSGAVPALGPPADRDVRVVIAIQEPTTHHRIDFGVHVDATVAGKTHTWKMAVECDGHAYHYLLAAQAESDHNKDVALTDAGYSVIRVHGSSIWNNLQDECQRIVQPTLERCRYLSRR